MNINKGKIFKWVKIITIIYCVIGIALYYLQEKFMFHPRKLESNYVFQFNNKFEEIKLPVNNEDTISLVKFLPADTIRKGIVLYYHGNRNNVEHYARYADLFLKYGYEVWMGDYPGFGKTTGNRTEQKMYDQARMIQKLAYTKYNSDSIIIYGKSLGTGIATYVASYVPAKALVLETPYYSMTSLFGYYAFTYPTGYMIRYKIPLHEYIQEVRYPVIIFHGTADNVIPISNARKLQPLLKQSDKFITIKNGKHNNLPTHQEYIKMIDSLLQ